MDTLVLTEMTLKDILENWRPGTWRRTWKEEAFYLKTYDTARMNKITRACRYWGFDFADDTAPIKLGNDGRVWNGHHRLVSAMDIRPQTLMVYLVGPDERELG